MVESTALATDRVERRLAAILAADVAGYSRLMGVDEEGTHERLKAHFGQVVHPKIKEYRGRIVKNTGDGLLAEFSSVLDAVRCAIEIQLGMIDREPEVVEDRRIAFRIGINLGDVIVEEDDVYGDGVNIAARLEALAELGGICVSRVVRDQVRDKLNVTFKDLGEQQLKNIARPVRVYRIQAGAPAAETDRTPWPLPNKPSIAVLPFANLTSDPEQDFLSYGIAEDIITSLSRFPWLFVIARNSCFTYTVLAVDVRQVGRELGVRYVLEGSIRKLGNRVRVNAQLIEAEGGRELWADRYDRNLADIFALQDEIAEAVTIAIAPAIGDAEVQRAMRKPPGNLDAWAAYQRRLWHLGKVSAEEYVRAETFFQQAIALDPSFGGGYRGLAFAQFQEAAVFQTRGLHEAQISAEALARRAVALDGADAESRSCLGQALWARGELEGMQAEAEQALAISPNLALAHGVLAAALLFSGQPKEGLAVLETCNRLNPRDYATLPLRLNQVALGLYFSGEYEAAVQAAKRGIRSYPEFPLTYRWLAAALGELGRTEEAKEALKTAIAIAPASFDIYVRRRVSWMRREDYAHMLDGRARPAGKTEFAPGSKKEAR